MHTPQTDFWQGAFGDDYTQRNSRSADEWDAFYIANYGVTKLEMNRRFLSDVPADTSFLEIGCNTGLQLQGLTRMGFRSLTGIDLQAYAGRLAKQLLPGAKIACASGLALPFGDASFDVVFTSGVLIHVAPADLNGMFLEMARCARRYVWGFEYFAAELSEIPYRGHAGYLWKGDYSRLLSETCPDLQLVRREIFPHTTDSEKGNVDAMYLLEKRR